MTTEVARGDNERDFEMRTNDPLSSLQLLNVMESKDSIADLNKIPTMFDDMELDQNIFRTPSSSNLSFCLLFSKFFC